MVNYIYLKDSNIEYIVVDGIKYFNSNYKYKQSPDNRKGQHWIEYTAIKDITLFTSICKIKIKMLKVRRKETTKENLKNDNRRTKRH
jgi:hypothetical protein